MKESYQKLELPEETQKEENAKKEKEKEKKKKKSQKNKSKDSEESENQTVTFESEYNDLVDMKKYLTAKLHDKPKSKTLLKSLNECKDSIKKLVKKARNKNTKNYHKLINSHKQKMTNEMEYFKKKLSNKEQLKIMNDLKEVNDQIQVNIPYRVKLLDSQVPNKYKADDFYKLSDKTEYCFSELNIVNQITPAQLTKILLDNFNSHKNAYNDIIKFVQ